MTYNDPAVSWEVAETKIADQDLLEQVVLHDLYYSVQPYGTIS